MKLSNTMMMDGKLMPSTKRAFTLAEVLITLSILGVVAALTIPSLVNRQSDLAAQVKLKKAISNYEDVIGIYMAEKETADASEMIEDCTGITDYFKAVNVDDSTSGYCDFTTADGVAWRFEVATGNAVVTDNKEADSARYQVVMWNANNRVNTNGKSDNVSNVLQSGKSAINTTPYKGSSLIDKSRTIVAAPDFLQNTFYCPKDKGAALSGTAPDHKVDCQ